MRFRVTINFLSDWHCGTGRGTASHIDAVIARDAFGLPYVPGRSLRGVLREGVRQLVEFGHAPKGATEVLFGDEGFVIDALSGETSGVRGTRPGCLNISNARLPGPMIEYFDPDAWSNKDEYSDKTSKLLKTLTRTLAMTAIDAESGTAKAQSLRMIEVAIPMTLSAEIEIVPVQAGRGRQASMQSEIIENSAVILKNATVLCDGIGAHRTRGLGRCSVVIEAEDAK